MRGSVVEAHLHPPPHASSSSPSRFFDGNRFESSLSSKSNSSNFPAILTHFSVDMVEMRTGARLRSELHSRKHLVWKRHAINQITSTSYTVLSGDISGMSVRLSVWLFVFTRWCISPTRTTSASREKGFISVAKNKNEYIKKGEGGGNFIFIRHLQKRCGALGRFGKTLRKSYSWRHGLGFTGFLLFI